MSSATRALTPSPRAQRSSLATKCAWLRSGWMTTRTSTIAAAAMLIVWPVRSVWPTHRSNSVQMLGYTSLYTVLERGDLNVIVSHCFTVVAQLWGHLWTFESEREASLQELQLVLKHCLPRGLHSWLNPTKVWSSESYFPCPYVDISDIAHSACCVTALCPYLCLH